MKKICLLIALALVLLLCTACDKGTWEEHYDLGMKYLSEENYEEAVVEFTAAIEIDDTKPEAFLGRAKAYAFLGDSYEQAIADFEKVIELNPKSTDAYLGLADIYRKRGNKDELNSILNKALEKVSKDDLQKVLDYVNALDLKEKQRNKILSIDGENKENLYNIEKERIMKDLKTRKKELEANLIGGVWLTRSYGNWCLNFTDENLLLECRAVPTEPWTCSYNIHYNKDNDLKNDFDISKLDKKLYLTKESLRFEDKSPTGEFFTQEIHLNNENELVVDGDVYKKYGSYEEIFKVVGLYE